jgi:hypothetical protein
LGVGRPRYQPYLDKPPAPFAWRLGLRPLDLAGWIEIDDRYDADVAAKARHSEQVPNTVLRWLPDVEAESQEVLEVVVEHLRALDPSRFGHLTSDPGDLHPLDAAGRLVQEDLVVLVARDGRLVCGGGSVCFPNRWDLASKVGRSMSEIHSPVAQLNEQLGAPIDKALERLTPERSFWRLGYGLIETPELYLPVDGTAPSAGDDVPAERYHLRVERETLRRLPRTGCILFTIRTYIDPICDVAGADAAVLAAALEAMPDDVLDYKKLVEVAPAIVAYLRAAA